MILNCLLTGVGGQGTVLLSRLIGAAALDRGLEVRGSETIGMAQRGGSVVSHIRMGRGIAAPLIPPGRADVIIAFEIAEAVRAAAFMGPSTRLLVLDRVLRPASALGAYDAGEMLEYLEKRAAGLTVIDGRDLALRCGGSRAINTALLGTALGQGLFPFDVADVRRVLTRRIPPAWLEMNLRALDAGLELGGKPV